MTKEHKKNNSTYNIAMCGVLTALAMIFSYIESIIPVPIPVPGIKLGVANIAVITILYTLGIKEAVIINILRISLTAMLFGNLNSFLFSIAGAVLSMVTMIVLKKIDSFSYIGVSVSGAIMHNVGQIIAAIFIMGSSAIIYYLPVLIIAGVITGIIIGIVSGIVVKYVKKGAYKNTIFKLLFYLCFLQLLKEYFQRVHSQSITFYAVTLARAVAAILTCIDSFFTHISCFSFIVSYM